MRYLFLFIIPFLSQEVYGDPWKNLDSGDQTAKALLSQMEADKSKAGANPFYQGIPGEANLNDSDLTARSQRASNQDPISQFLRTSSDTRPKFNIDPKDDPLLTGSEKILAKQLEAIGGKGTQSVEIQQKGVNETHVCEEAGEDAQYTCQSNLNVKIKEVFGPTQTKSFTLRGRYIYANYTYLINHWPKEKRKHYIGYIQVTQPILINFIASQTNLPSAHILSASAQPSGNWRKVRKKMYTFKFFTFTYNYRPIIKVPEYSWDNKCDALEEKADAGNCFYTSKVCTQGPETRVIDGVSVYQPCWQYTFTYNCAYPSKNDCGPLRAKGCTQIDSTCKQKVGRSCVVYQQTYQCKGNPKTSHSISGGKTPFCLDGNCRDQSWEPNDEMMSSMAQLSLLKEMQGQFAGGLLFKGEDKRCSRFILKFKDCCGSGKGWGKDLGLSSCSSGEKALAQKRHKGLCHFVGTYCAKKVLGKCIKKKSSYCCFNNKLLKAFHEQGRPQIGLGWGEPKEPLCRGFTIDEIQRIDFSKLDLREVFEEIMQNFKPGKLNSKEMGQKINERMQTIQKSMVPGLKTPPKQGNGA